MGCFARESALECIDARLCCPLFKQSRRALRSAPPGLIEDARREYAELEVCLTEQQSSSPAQRFATFDEDADEDAPMWHSWVDIRKVGARVRVEQELPGFCGCVEGLKQSLPAGLAVLCRATVPLPLVCLSSSQTVLSRPVVPSLVLRQLLFASQARLLTKAQNWAEVRLVRGW